MSISCYNAVWGATGIRDLYKLAVLLALADDADDHGNVWPRKTEEHAEKARLSVRKFQYVVRELTDDKVLSVVPGSGRGSRNRIKLNLHNMHLLRCEHPVENYEKGCTEEQERVHGDAGNGARKGGAIERAREKLLKAPKDSVGEKRPAKNPVYTKPEKQTAKSISADKAMSAWSVVEAQVNDHLANSSRFRIEDGIACRVFNAMGGPKKVCEEYGRDGPALRDRFVEEYVRLEVAEFQQRRR